MDAPLYDKELDHPFSCNPYPARPKTNILFDIYDDSEPPLDDSPSPFIIESWAKLMDNYPGDLGVTLRKILTYGCLVGEESKERTLHSRTRVLQCLIRNI